MAGELTVSEMTVDREGPHDRDNRGDRANPGEGEGRVDGPHDSRGDRELLGLFGQEAAERLTRMAGILRREVGPAGRELLTVLHRDAHALKGAAAVVGLDGIAGVARAMEELLAQVRDGRRPLDGEVLEALAGSVRGLSAAVSAALAGRDPSGPEGSGWPGPGSAGQDGPGMPRSRGRVVVVDDVLTVREAGRRLLEGAGYQVRTAGDGVEALALLLEAPADLVVADLEMPRMGGFELTRALRSHPALAGVPVLILTSRSGEEDRRRGLACGADAYVVKGTLGEAALLEVVAGLVDGVRRDRPGGGGDGPAGYRDAPGAPKTTTG
jgi:CheY-like chemotaxis protein/HPt (histidine-containing phosphotransfer) domain-containing protein